MMRIGILGGTFDPVHYGHLRPAAEVMAQLTLDQLWLLPNHIPPHKQSATANSEQRLQMLNLACQEYRQFGVNTLELSRLQPSYSVTTLAQLRQQHADDSLYFIMGTDSLVTLSTWHQWQQLFALCHLVVCGRSGWQMAPDNPAYFQWQQRQCSVAQHLAQAPTAAGHIIMADVALQPYSSTAVRLAIQQHDVAFCRQALPTAVWDYICQQQLYRG